MRRLIDQEQKSIKEIWDRTQYIPIYQREFVWEDEHIQNSIRTIFEDMEEGVESYMGNILMTEHVKGEKKGYEIVDGQQRTTFAFLVIKSIYEIFESLTIKIPSEEKYYGLIDDIKDEMNKAKDLLIVEKENRYDEEHKPRIFYASEKLNKVITSTLEGIVTGATKNRKFRIVKMQEKIKNLILSTLLDKENPTMKNIEIIVKNDEYRAFTKNVIGFFDYFINSIKYIEIKLKESKYATEVFERMNSTSKPLTDYELFKNYIAGQLLSNDSGDVENMISGLDDIVNDENNKLDANVIIRGLLYLKEGKVTSSKYKFNKLKNIYSKEANPSGMYREVKSFIENYSNLEKLQLDGEDHTYLPYLIIKTYNFKQLKPAIIAMTKIYGHTTEVSNLFMMLISLIFKKVVFNGEVANVIESMLARIFNSNGKMSKPEEVMNKLKLEKSYKESLTDEMTIQKFNKIGKNEFVKVLWVYSINKSMGNVKSITDSKDTEIKINFDKIQIEHILPRSWEANWSEVVGEMSNDDRKELIDNPGNKLPILGKYNVQASNKPFDQKKLEHYVMSSFNDIKNDDVASSDKWVITEIDSMATKVVANAEHWTQEKIEERSKQMMDFFSAEIEKFLLNN